MATLNLLFQIKSHLKSLQHMQIRFRICVTINIQNRANIYFVVFVEIARHVTLNNKAVSRFFALVDW